MTAAAAAEVAARPGPRRREVDRLRATMIVGVVAYHAALVFDTGDDFYVKNDATVDLTGAAAGFVVVWAMPLMFALAGLAAAHSLRRRGPLRLVRERLIRLGVPLVAATVLVTPFPQWLRARAAGEPDARTYLGFWRSFLDVHLDVREFPFVLQGRYFELGHLWFLLLLLVGSITVAAVAAVPGTAGVLDRWSSRVASRRGAVLVPALLVGAACGPRLEEAYAAGSRWGYLVTFAASFALLADDRVRVAVRRDRWWALAAGLAAFNAAGVTFLSVDEPLTSPSVAAILGRCAFGAAGWCCVVAIVGFLDRPVPAADEAARPLARADAGRGSTAEPGDLVLPVYVLHQPIVVAVAWLVVPTGLPGPAKYVAIVLAGFGLTLAVAAAAARSNPTRVMLGMRYRSGGPSGRRQEGQ